MEGSGARNSRLLLAEDDETLREFGSLLLTGMGFHVDTAADGLAALTALQGGAYDVAVLDVRMPGLDGVAVAVALRAHAATATLPIIALTADATGPERRRCLDAGMNEVLLKPVDRAQLTAALIRAGALAVEPPPLDSAPHSWGAGAAFDVAQALDRVGGHHEALLRGIALFCESQAGASARLAEALGAGDVAAALAALHALRGAAGSLSATALFHTVVAVETLLRDGDAEEARIQLTALDAAMTQALADGAALLTAPLK